MESSTQNVDAIVLIGEINQITQTIADELDSKRKSRKIIKELGKEIDYIYATINKYPNIMANTIYRNYALAEKKYSETGAKYNVELATLNDQLYRLEHRIPPLRMFSLKEEKYTKKRIAKLEEKFSQFAYLKDEISKREEKYMLFLRDYICTLLSNERIHKAALSSVLKRSLKEEDTMDNLQLADTILGIIIPDEMPTPIEFIERLKQFVTSFYSNSIDNFTKIIVEKETSAQELLAKEQRKLNEFLNPDEYKKENKKK